MAGMGPAPSADGVRRRNKPTFGWTLLPKSGRKGPPPALGEPPEWMAPKDSDGFPTGPAEWPESTVAAWAALWSTPQACQWDPSGLSLHGWAELHGRAAMAGRTAVINAEMRQVEDRHGLSPKALLQLRWRVVADEDATVNGTPTGAQPPKARVRAARPKRDGDPRLRSVK
jgi:hypothetical protein